MSPTPRALWVLGAWSVFGLAASFQPALASSWLAGGVLLGAALLLDAVATWRARPPSVVRRVPSTLPVGISTRVKLCVETPGARSRQLRIYDHHPTSARVDGFPLTLRVPAGQRAEESYTLLPEARGEHRFGHVEVWQRSPLALWERQHLVGEPETVRVYPNFRAAEGYEMLAAANRAGMLGIRRRPRRGEGLEFHQLRDYREGDSLRQIDWKATSRLRRAISREHQDERDQQVVFLLDCGRRLHARDGSRSHFDAALDAVLLAAHVALRQGDAVGLLTFSGERRWLAPRKGASQANALLNTVFDLRTSTRASDYAAAARDLVVRLRKRALVVLVSNLRDEDAGELAASLRLLSRHHLVMLASLRETALAEVLKAPIRDLQDALRTASVRHYLEQRRSALEPLQRTGALLLESDARHLSTALANRYLDVKAAGIL